jgi:inosose dehydratase
VRVAGAPISWGVCEVPGWGYQLPAGRVLGDMRDLGLTATEFGPAGFMPADAAGRKALLASYGLDAAGGFVPVVLHEPGLDPLPDVDRAVDGLGTVSAVLVLAAATGADGYDTRPELGAEGWRTLLANLDRASARAAERGYTAVLHPHVGTMVERTAEVERVLDGTGIGLCLDTGHLLIGGTDPGRLAARAADRVGHVHLKDADAGLAGRVAAGEVAYTTAVRDGMYRPLGQGDAGIRAVVGALEGAGYKGWYVLEQDTMLAGEGDDPLADIRASLDYLKGHRRV